MNSAYRVRVTLEPTAVWPRTKRGVCSAIACEACGVTLRARSHAEARKALRMHTLDAHTNARKQCRPNAGGQIVHEFATTKDGERCSCGVVVWKSLTDA